MIKCSVVRILISRSGQLKGGNLTDEDEVGESDADLLSCLPVIGVSVALIHPVAQHLVVCASPFL